MTTIINNPGDSTRNTEDSGGGSGLVLGVLLAVVIGAILFFIYGLPGKQERAQPDATVNVPDQIRVDIEGSEDGTTN